MKRKIKKNYKFLLGVIVGTFLSGIGVYATTVLSSSDVSYDNSKSGGSSTSVQGAIEELYKLSEESGKKCPAGYTCIRNTVAAAYTYNQTSGASNYCVTGQEATCQKTECYQNKAAGSCPAGTIINFKVNSTQTVPFHVMFDNGETMTMQSQKNVVNNIVWEPNGKSSNGPTTIVPALENATSGWSNVDDQTYSLGTTNFSGKGYFTSCNNGALSCSSNIYKWGSRTAKSRLMTVQEAQAFGCNGNSNNCPVWIKNYLSSTGYGATMTVSGASGYWLMNGHDYGYYAFAIYYMGYYNTKNTYQTGIGARAVVVVSK